MNRRTQKTRPSSVHRITEYRAAELLYSIGQHHHRLSRVYRHNLYIFLYSCVGIEHISRPTVLQRRSPAASETVAANIIENIHIYRKVVNRGHLLRIPARLCVRVLVCVCRFKSTPESKSPFVCDTFYAPHELRSVPKTNQSTNGNQNRALFSRWWCFINHKNHQKTKKKPHLLNYKSFHIKLQLYTIKSVAKSNTQLHHSAPHVSHFGNTVCVGASQTSRAHISLMNQRPYRSQHRQPTISQHQSTV